MIIQTNYGLGDNIYLRPVLKWLPPCELITPWPQVFWDMPVKICKPKWVGLRTQMDNVDTYQGYGVASDLPDYTMSYNLEHGTIIENYCKILLEKEPKWLVNKFPLKDTWTDEACKLVNTDKPICLVRPNTIRSEWPCPARNPHSCYLQQFIDTYRDKFHFISVANIKDKEEWITDKLDCDQYIFNKPIEMIFGLFGISTMILCSPSFWTALALALDKPCLAIYGAHEPHNRINDSRCKSSKMIVVEPEPFDRCMLGKMNAFKDIKQEVLLAKFKEVIDATYSQSR